LPIVKPLTAGWGPVVFFEEQYYNARVLECERPIEPGKCGEATIGIMSSYAENLNFREGSVFELRDGPKTSVATATVLSYSLV
jgi:hypothetical protein